MSAGTTPETASAKPASIEPATILVIEDDDAIRQLLVKRLEVGRAAGHAQEDHPLRFRWMIGQPGKPLVLSRRFAGRQVAPQERPQRERPQGDAPATKSRNWHIEGTRPPQEARL